MVDRTGVTSLHCIHGIMKSNMTKCGIDDFIIKLDKFLENVPDEPHVRGLVPRACTPDARPSNSIMDQVKMVQKGSHGR